MIEGEREADAVFELQEKQAMYGRLDNHASQVVAKGEGRRSTHGAMVMPDDLITTLSVKKKVPARRKIEDAVMLAALSTAAWMVLNGLSMVPLLLSSPLVAST
jgi:hypothetical protein